MIQKSKKTLSETQQQSTRAGQENRDRKQRNAPGAPGKVEEIRSERAASERMVDEGGPSPKP